MAVDEVMLETAVEGRSSIRFYAWRPATLSLGYFQRHEERLGDAKLAALPWVRRPTGGGAIIHQNDLTYAVALAPNLRGNLASSEWHCRLHQAFRLWLEGQGLAAEVVSGARPALKDLAFLCFAVPQPGDVLLGREKVIGGAQRLRKGALLQHGSIQVPGLPSNGGTLARALADEFGWQLEPADWSRVEQQRIQQLTAEKYSQPWWNQKR
jgi:lipoate-protein ligase A